MNFAGALASANWLTLDGPAGALANLLILDGPMSALANWLKLKAGANMALIAGVCCLLLTLATYLLDWHCDSNTLNPIVPG